MSDVAGSLRFGRSPVRRLCIGIALICTFLPALDTVAAHAASPAVHTTSWLTYHLRNSRNGNDVGEPAFTSVNRSWHAVFGASDHVYAEPLVYKGTVYAATEGNNIYAIRASTGHVAWMLNVGTPVTSSTLPCGNINPVVGITSTPVIDPVSNTLYALAFTTSAGTDSHTLFAINLTSHSVSWSAAADPVPSLVGQEHQQAALAIANGNVYVGYGGLYGDCGNYHGFVVAISTTTHTMSTYWEAAAAGTDHGAGIEGTSGPAVDSSGNVYVATSNGYTNGYDYSETVAKLTSSLTLSATWAPADWQTLDSGDVDLGTIGPLLLSNSLVFQAGRGARGYLVRPSGLNQIGTELYSQQLNGAVGCDGGDAFDGARIYVGCAGGGLFGLTLNGHVPSFSIAWQFGTGSFNPPILAGNAVWSISNGTLFVLDPATGAPKVPSIMLSDTTTPLATPSAANGRIFVPENNSIESFVLTP